jgi:hypothetical protein
MVCGVCCTLTEGGLNVYAVCLECDRKKGKSLTSGWTSFLVWLIVPILLLAAIVALLAWFTQK